MKSNVVATRANALWQRWRTRRDVRQRTGRNPHECAVAKVKPLQLNQKPFGRNPHECAVAKLHGFSRFRKTSRRNPHECAVAKYLTDARCPRRRHVATRTNALWQRDAPAPPPEMSFASQPARMRCGKGCAPAPAVRPMQSQPARMRCGKDWRKPILCKLRPSQPARMRCGKARRACLSLCG